jgi:hypothetical protein
VVKRSTNGTGNHAGDREPVTGDEPTGDTTSGTGAQLDPEISELARTRFAKHRMFERVATRSDRATCRARECVLTG